MPTAARDNTQRHLSEEKMKGRASRQTLFHNQIIALRDFMVGYFAPAKVGRNAKDAFNMTE